MQRESQKDRTILCKVSRALWHDPVLSKCNESNLYSVFPILQYDPTEPGDYRVEVKWANELVPGSPFPVMIFDTEEELRRFIQGM